MMNPRTRGRIADVLVAVVVLGLIGRYATTRPPKPQKSDFEQQVDLAPLARVAVQRDGRYRSFDSHAKTFLKFVTGPRTINAQSPAFTYLDLMLRSERYNDVDIIYVKNELVRRRISEALERIGAAPADRLKSFNKSGLIARKYLELPAIRALRDDLSKDLIKTAKPMDQLDSALSIAQPAALANILQLIPPPGGDALTPWLPASFLWTAADPQGAMKAGINGDHAGALDKVDPQLAADLQKAWARLVKGWQSQEAGAVNAAVNALADLLPRVEPKLYPSTKSLFWESWYFRYHGLTWVWSFYLLSVIFLLLSVVYRFPWARKAGLGIFAVSLLAHTAAVGLRFYVSGRWPNSNMFEAVTTSAWFGGLIALIIERFARKTPLRGLFALASAVASMVALMAGHFIPELDPTISNKMAALNDIWIYIHTNVIISSYCLIFMACVSALGYLRYRLGGGSAEVSRSGGAGTLVMNSVGGNFLLDEKKTNTGVILDAWTMVLMELSFVMLWAGLVMGAIWADHSWGRPWGWDPKEIFALNTFIIFLLLVHVRIKVRDKGLWTALLAVAGCGVMLFNWIVINFIVSGLHSYA